MLISHDALLETSALPDMQVDPASPFAEELQAMVEENARIGGTQRPVVFYGSSSIRLWEELQRDFAGLRVLNRGFGGSTLADCVREFDRLITPLQPSALVLYAGDNDLDQGATPEHLLSLFRCLMGIVRARLGGVPVLVISVKPSPIRFWNNRNIQRTNQLLAQACLDHGAAFLDLYPGMLDERGQPRRELFGADGLHMSRAGYQLWAREVRRALPVSGGTA